MAEEPRSAGQQLRRALAEDLVLAPGVFDAVSARLAAVAGFCCVHASGGSIVRSLGLPDLGLADMSEMLRAVATIVEAAGVPVVADADSGYGNALNVRRTVRLFEKAGVAGLHIEDQAFPKRCGHYAGVRLVDTAEMVGKLKMAVDARCDEQLLIIARTDAVAVEKPEAVLDRAERYREAGADMVFVEGLRSAEAIEDWGAWLPGWKLLNAGLPGVPLPVERGRLASLGFRLVVFPGDLQSAAIHAMADTLSALRRDGDSAALAGRLAPPEQRDALVDLPDWQARATLYDI